MKQFKTISIKKVVQSSVGKLRAEKYFLGIDKADLIVLVSPRMSDKENANNIYQGTLSKLVKGDMEKAINYIVFGLEVDRENTLLFNLAKNLIFSLNKQMEDNADHLIKQRYSDDSEMNKNIIKLKIEEVQKNIDKENNKLDKLERELNESKPKFFSVNKLFITYQIKKRFLKPQIIELKESDNLNKESLIDLQNELKKTQKILVLEEYFKILSLVIEVCIFPNRFQTYL